MWTRSAPKRGASSAHEVRASCFRGRRQGDPEDLGHARTQPARPFHRCPRPPRRGAVVTAAAVPEESTSTPGASSTSTSTATVPARRASSRRHAGGGPRAGQRRTSRAPTSAPAGASPARPRTGSRPRAISGRPCASGPAPRDGRSPRSRRSNGERPRTAAAPDRRHRDGAAHWGRRSWENLPSISAGSSHERPGEWTRGRHPVPQSRQSRSDSRCRSATQKAARNEPCRS